MSYSLILGDAAYSSWSMRVGLLVYRAALPVEIVHVPLYGAAFDAFRAEFAPARTVPALRLQCGTVITESLAIAEEFANRFPEAGLWPVDPAHRAVARAIAGEMHSGFAALRAECPMNLRAAYSGVPVSGPVMQDLARLETIWAAARNATSAGGVWLCGEYSIADAFFAPVAARIAGYNLPVCGAAAAYVAAHLSEPAFLEWRARALMEGPDQPVYARPFPQRPWPVDRAGLNQS